MTDSLRAKVIWIVLLLATQAIQGIAQEELRIAPRDETIAYSWQWRTLFCDVADAPATYSIVTYAPELVCRPPGELCSSPDDCCDGYCRDWRCQ